MKKKVNKICFYIASVSFILLVTMAIVAIIDRFAQDMLSAIVVQIALAAIFISSFLGTILTIEN